MFNRDYGSEAFEQLWLLRACYPLRSDYDVRSTLTVDQAVLYGEHLLRNARIRDQWAGWGGRGPASRAA